MTTTDGTPALSWRPAGPQDAVALLDLERAANLVGLAHVFDAAQHPFPDEAVLARWQEILVDPDVRVEVVDDPSDGRLLAYTAHDATILRHLAVHPEAWGRGLGADGVARAVASIGPGARLWVLDVNTRARALYERLGWAPTGVTQVCPWPPHPTELQYRAPATPAGDLDG
ncbi:MAG: GNAT family N-acetyltransferase [Nocardioides sp.]|uniref:GNAT family N-acetyltransferase n=1 Tax=Nocardioides sp. TaxID=35761 RepID=UPI003F0E825A